MGRSKGGGRRKRHRKHKRSMHNHNPLPTEAEKQILNRIKQEGYALPTEFANWTRYFFSQQRYVMALTNWFYAKQQARGGKVKIEADMEPHGHHQAQELPEGGSWDDDPINRPAPKKPWTNQREWQSRAPLLKIKPPSGISVPPSEAPHMVL